MDDARVSRVVFAPAPRRRDRTVGRGDARARARADAASSEESTRAWCVDSKNTSTLTIALELARDDAATELEAADASARAWTSTCVARAGNLDGRDGDVVEWSTTRRADDSAATAADADAAARERRMRNRRGRLARVVIEQWRWVVENGSGTASTRAREVWARRAARAALEAWRGEARETRRRIRRAGIYARLITTQRTFDAWRVEASMRSRTRAREASVRRCARRWRATAAAAARARERADALEYVSRYHDWTRLVTRGFRAWREACAPAAKAVRAKENLCDRYARKTLLKRAMDAWVRVAEDAADARANKLVAVMFHEVKTCVRAIRAWRGAVAAGERDREEKAITFQSYRTVNALGSTFAAWVDLTRGARKKSSQVTPAKTRAGRTKNALYGWLFHRKETDGLHDFLDELDQTADDDLEAAVAEYEELREQARRLANEAKALKSGTSTRDVARRRVLRSTAMHLRRRREELLPLVRCAASEIGSRPRSVGSSSFGSSFTDSEEDDDRDDFLAGRKF